MLDTCDANNTVYIKSNAATVMHLLSFLMVVLFTFVVGLSAHVFLTYANQQSENFDQSNLFYYTIENNAATITKFVDTRAVVCNVPDLIESNGKKYPVIAVGENAFANHRYLQSVTLPDSVTKIMGNPEKQSGAFSCCTALTTVNLGQKLSKIDVYAFSNCVALSSIEIPANVQFVREGAFENCLNLSLVQIDGNGTLKPSCFENCLNVETLRLSDAVKLSDESKEALADLVGLKNFEIFGDNSVYSVNDNGDCLLTTTDAENDTVVLGGKNADLPTGITQITNWAWGERAYDNFFIPSTVQKVGPSAFAGQDIYTDAVNKPDDWKMTSIHYNAQLVNFSSLGESVYAYIYDNQNGEKVYPQYDKLFTDLESETPFEKWILIDDVNYEAKFMDSTKGTEAFVLLYNSELSKSRSLIENVSAQKKFTIDFWEKFKSVYYSVVNQNPVFMYDYQLKEIRDNLCSYNTKIENAMLGVGDDQSILETEKWDVKLQNLINQFERIDLSDLMDTSENRELIDKINALIREIEVMLSSNEYEYNTVLPPVWNELRNDYEALLADVTPAGLLGRLIQKCENLDAKKYNTNSDSWLTLQNCLTEAYQITEHNQSITVVREKLQQAYNDLSEILDEENVVEFKAWYLICQNLNQEDYKADGYDKLWLKLLTIDENDFENNAKLESLVNDLQISYDSLVLLETKVVGKTNLLNFRTIPFFVLDVILFLGAALAGSGAVKIKRQLRRNRE